MIEMNAEFLAKRMPGLLPAWVDKHGYLLADMIELQDVIIH